jgi:endonuclease/exonuclease/phosphatase family metal-dependent hydrolase
METIDGPKIDYVFVRPETDVLSAEIVRTSRDGRYPSDHFPVTARIRLVSTPVR